MNNGKNNLALNVQNISSGYGEVQILWNVSISLERGKLTSLVGANGVGKTTLLRTIVGLLKFLYLRLV